MRYFESPPLPRSCKHELLLSSFSSKPTLTNILFPYHLSRQCLDRPSAHNLHHRHISLQVSPNRISQLYRYQSLQSVCYHWLLNIHIIQLHHKPEPKHSLCKDSNTNAVAAVMSAAPRRSSFTCSLPLSCLFDVLAWDCGNRCAKPRVWKTSILHILILRLSPDISRSNKSCMLAMFGYTAIRNNQVARAST